MAVAIENKDAFKSWLTETLSQIWSKVTFVINQIGQIGHITDEKCRSESVFTQPDRPNIDRGPVSPNQIGQISVRIDCHSTR